MDLRLAAKKRENSVRTEGTGGWLAGNCHGPDHRLSLKKEFGQSYC